MLNKKYLFVALFVIVALFSYKCFVSVKIVKNISSFDECVTANNGLVLETYPERCVTKDGHSFDNPKQKSKGETVGL